MLLLYIINVLNCFYIQFKIGVLNVKRCKKKCVWGKTNRCSKKRSTRKQTKTKTKSKSNVNCPSHKDKDECVKNHCCWGKTNRCSKKRIFYNHL